MDPYMGTTPHSALFLTQEAVQRSKNTSFYSGRTHPHPEGISPVTHMLKQTGLFLEWNLPLQALEAKEDRYGES